MKKFFSWLLNLFKRNKTPQLPRNPDTPTVERIAIIVGHTKKQPGAKNYLGEHEYDWNTKIAKEMYEYIKNYSTKEVGVFRRDGIGRTGVAEKVADWKADLSIELHFNSFKKKAYGCEVLVHKNARNYQHTFRIADELTDALATAFQLKERNEDGVKSITDKDRGAYNLRALIDRQVKYVILVEPCFANIKTAESAAIMEQPQKYAEVVAEYLVGL
jgi:N-acetylmuramoyl-L-alanine amidase